MTVVWRLVIYASNNCLGEAGKGRGTVASVAVVEETDCSGGRVVEDSSATS